jgi:hypothetical protein
MISSSYSLLSPPISNSRATAKLPSLVDRAFSDSSISDTRSTSHRGRDKDLAELRPLLFNKRGNSFSEYLPPIQDVMTPSASPSPPFDSYFVSSSPSSIASSPTPADDEPYLSFSSPPQDHLIVLATPTSISPVSDRRKGSIASLLNSDPELRQLDEEENKCNYLSHFVSPVDMQLSSSLKRGRPRHDVIDQNATMKKRKCQLPASCKSLDNSTAFDCLQACQSTATENTNSKLSVLSDTPRATKGLRHFSKQVCDKVAEKGVTTYNEVRTTLLPLFCFQFLYI